MRKASIGITPEGVPSIGLSALASVVFALFGCWFMAVIFLLLTAFCTYFFRDPERVVPTQPGVAVSPADGKIVRIASCNDPLQSETRQCVSIFMNVFSVHVNRMPVAGKIKQISYKPGRYLNAAMDKASEDNERCAYAIEDKDGALWTMVQIAGLIARRIVCRVDEGDKLERGERFGLIKFGSRMDVYLPEGYVPNVAPGDQVFAGQTILARKGGD